MNKLSWAAIGGEGGRGGGGGEGITCPTDGTPLRMMYRMYWPGGATVKSGGAWHVVVPAAVPELTAVQASTSWR